MTPEKSPGVYLCSARRARVHSAMRRECEPRGNTPPTKPTGRSLMPQQTDASQHEEHAEAELAEELANKVAEVTGDATLTRAGCGEFFVADGI